MIRNYWNKYLLRSILVTHKNSISIVNQVIYHIMAPLMLFFVFLFFLVLLILLAWMWMWNQGQPKRSVNIRGVAHNTGLIERYWLDRTTYLRQYLIEIAANSGGVDETIKQLVLVRGQIGKGYSVTLTEATGKRISQYIEAKDKTIASIFKAIQLDLKYDEQLQNLNKINDGLAETLSKNFSDSIDRNTIKKYLQDIDNSTIQQAYLYFKRDYRSSIASFELTRVQISDMNKYLSSRLLGQAVSLVDGKSSV